MCVTHVKVKMVQLVPHHGAFSSLCCLSVSGRGVGSMRGELDHCYLILDSSGIGWAGNGELHLMLGQRNLLSSPQH